ncbi:proteoglycan 4-like [Planococcus citri]|uniref:proteoglycan 4-like n=1 Tax=Planococcus citri TaxID=170843 RepID=UPI0031F72CB5
MVCLLEERVCNLVLVWCITVIAHHCKLVKLQSSISDYKPSDLWSYDDIEVARPQNESNIRLVKNNHGDSFYIKSDDRKITRLNDEDVSRDDLPSLRNRDHFGSRTNIEIPIGSKSNDGEISISKKITFNGNNSRANNHPLWYNALEKNAMSLPASISFNLKNLYAGERKSESTKRPYENSGVVFASKNIPLNSSSLSRHKMKYQQANYEPEYDEPALPPSLPNLEIIPFVASDALDKPKEPVADRKEGIEYVEDETTPTDPADLIKKFSPPSLTEGGFIPRDPTPDELYFEAIKFNRTYSPPPQIIITEITSEYRVTEPSQPKVPEIISEHPQHHYIEYSTMSTTTTTQKPATTASTTTTTTTTSAPPPPQPISTTTTTTENPPTPPEMPPTPVIHFLTTKAANYSTLMPLFRHTSTSTSTTTTTTTTTEDPSIEESEEGSDPEGAGGEEESEEEDEETIPIPDTEPVNKEPTITNSNNNTKEEPPAEPEDNSLLSNILTMIFDDYPVPPSKEKTTTLPPPSSSKKPIPAVKFTTPATKQSTPSSSIPPFKHVYIPPSFSNPSPTTTSTTTTTTTPAPSTTTTTQSTSTVKSMDKMGFISTRFSNNNSTTTMNETQQNQIKYVGLPQTFTYNQPVPKSTPKPVKERPSSHNEIYHSMKSDSVISGLLKLSGCNIFGKMYKTGEQIDELTEPCSRCICSEAGVHCIQTKC